MAIASPTQLALTSVRKNVAFEPEESPGPQSRKSIDRAASCYLQYPRLPSPLKSSHVWPVLQVVVLAPGLQ